MPRSDLLPTDSLEFGYPPTIHRDVTDYIAGQAEILATEIERGTIADRGGPDALRLLAALVRLGNTTAPPIVGHG